MVTVNGNRATFQFFRPGAASVWIVGDFNSWRPGELAMTPDGKGHWQATIYLSPGSHRFRYVADGLAFIDYASFGVEPGPFGYDSVVHVCASRRAQSRARGILLEGPEMGAGSTDQGSSFAASWGRRSGQYEPQR